MGWQAPSTVRETPSKITATLTTQRARSFSRREKRVISCTPHLKYNFLPYRERILKRNLNPVVNTWVDQGLGAKVTATKTGARDRALLPKPAGDERRRARWPECPCQDATIRSKLLCDFDRLAPPEPAAVRGNARVAELADALDLGSSAERRGGSNPPSRTSPCLAHQTAEALIKVAPSQREGTLSRWRERKSQLCDARRDRANPHLAEGLKPHKNGRLRGGKYL